MVHSSCVVSTTHSGRGFRDYLVHIVNMFQCFTQSHLIRLVAVRICVALETRDASCRSGVVPITETKNATYKYNNLGSTWCKRAHTHHKLSVCQSVCKVKGKSTACLLVGGWLKVQTWFIRGEEKKRRRIAHFFAIIRSALSTYCYHTKLELITLTQRTTVECSNYNRHVKDSCDSSKQTNAVDPLFLSYQ